eukprot:6280618-Pyramimonas_sp.AAC.1
MADASPQHGFNFFCITEARLQFHEDCDGPTPEHELHHRHLPITTMGRGKATEAMKSLSTQHAMALECGSAAAFVKN